MCELIILVKSYKTDQINLNRLTDMHVVIRCDKSWNNVPPFQKAHFLKFEQSDHKTPYFLWQTKKGGFPHSLEGSGTLCKGNVLFRKLGQIQVEKYLCSYELNLKFNSVYSNR